MVGGRRDRRMNDGWRQEGQRIQKKTKNIYVLEYKNIGHFIRRDRKLS